MGRAIGAAAIAAIVLAGAAKAEPEHLVIKPHPGAAWTRITDQTSHGAWNHEAIPPGETEDNFTQILTDQGFPDLAGSDPAAFLKQKGSRGSPSPATASA